MLIFGLILLTVAWGGLAFCLFAGTDFLIARLRGRGPAFEWFDNTRWSGRSTPGRQRTVSAMTYLAGGVVVILALVLVLGLLGLAVDGLLDSPRPPARPR